MKFTFCWSCLNNITMPTIALMVFDKWDAANPPTTDRSLESFQLYDSKAQFFLKKSIWPYFFVFYDQKPLLNLLLDSKPNHVCYCVSHNKHTTCCPYGEGLSLLWMLWSSITSTEWFLAISKKVMVARVLVLPVWSLTVTPSSKHHVD